MWTEIIRCDDCGTILDEFGYCPECSGDDVTYVTPPVEDFPQDDWNYDVEYWIDPDEFGNLGNNCTVIIRLF